MSKNIPYSEITTNTDPDHKPRNTTDLEYYTPGNVRLPAANTLPPTTSPTGGPTPKPTNKPTQKKSLKPTVRPTAGPTRPTQVPSEIPTQVPSEIPTQIPSIFQTQHPTQRSLPSNNQNGAAFGNTEIGVVAGLGSALAVFGLYLLKKFITRPRNFNQVPGAEEIVEPVSHGATISETADPENPALAANIELGNTMPSTSGTINPRSQATPLAPKSAKENTI